MFVDTEVELLAERTLSLYTDVFLQTWAAEHYLPSDILHWFFPAAQVDIL